MKTYGSTVATTAAFGLVLAFLPSSTLALVTQEPWEIDLVRFSGVFVVALGFLWPASIRSEKEIVRRLPRWLMAMSICGGAYLLRVSPLFLVLGFSMLVAGTLDAAFEQAFISSERVRRRTDASSVRR